MVLDYPGPLFGFIITPSSLTAQSHIGLSLISTINLELSTAWLSNTFDAQKLLKRNDESLNAERCTSPCPATDMAVVTAFDWFNVVAFV